MVPIKIVTGVTSMNKKGDSKSRIGEILFAKLPNLLSLRHLVGRGGEVKFLERLSK